MAKADWTAVRLAYVNSSDSYAQLAARFGLTDSAVEKRGEREGWARERRSRSEAVGAAAQAKIDKDRLQEIAEWNAADLRLAKAFRVQIARNLNNFGASAADPLELKTLLTASEIAQRVARTALGIARENPEPSAGAPERVSVNVQRKSARKAE